ncbi:Dph6-related ATP pyrophosphatase [Oceanobacillus picturae]|uniref:Dph6-related ATP pyrophosphatase n=1 Tax=Oceanobacillus picturae TaxID=171693 RepID=UPI003643360D
MRKGKERIVQDVIVSWSGGKDSAIALHTLQQSSDFRVVGLLSTYSEKSGRLPIHEVLKEMLYAQASSLNLPLYGIEMPDSVPNKAYERIMGEQFEKFISEGIRAIAYADLFLEDIKSYRERLLKQHGMRGVFPLWEEDTASVAGQFIEEGFKAIVTTVDIEVLPANTAGRMFNHQFLEDLPVQVDPCGENGEFHTFVYDGPNFQHRLPIIKGAHFQTFEGKFVHAEIILKS